MATKQASVTPAVTRTVGRPNVGKSALFNRLVGRSIAIVHDQPGITRDRLRATCNRGSKPFTVWDTGGIGGAGEKQLTEDVAEAAAAAMTDSAIILFVVDAQQGITPVDAELARSLRKAKVPIIVVVNKIDHPKHEDLESEFTRLGFETVVPMSAAHGRGVQELLEEIERRLPSQADDQMEGAASTAEDRLSLAIIGRPNAGKSSLINAIVHEPRTLVGELPGTTRDAVDIALDHGRNRFLLIDTAGMRARSKHSSSVEVFSVMRSERAIRRADVCVLVVDATEGVTGQDKRIAGLMQEARKPAVVVLNKWDLVKPKTGLKSAMTEVVTAAREQLFFLEYAPVLVASASTGENVEKLFQIIAQIRRDAAVHLGTGPLNRVLRAAFAANPPPMVSGHRLKLFYAAQAAHEARSSLEPPQFVLFVNDPKLLGETYARYLQARIRAAYPYAGVPVLLNCRPRAEKEHHSPAARRRS
jgi:GTP-binding protein